MPNPQLRSGQSSSGMAPRKQRDLRGSLRTRLLLIATALPSLALLGATCVTNVQQHGAAGPWVGEVANYDSSEVREVSVEARVFDADGNELAHSFVPTCPHVLAPGEHGTFEYFYDGYGAPAPRLPLSASFAAAYLPYGRRFERDGLTVREVRRDIRRHFALMELRNESALTYSNVEVCANLRTPGGIVAELGRAAPFPSTLRPGDARTFPIFFNSMPDGVLDVHAGGSPTCCPTVRPLDPGLFQITASKLIDDGERRVLRVIGEWRNPTGKPLGSARVSAEIVGSPADRVEGANAGCGDESVGGHVGVDGLAPAEFDIPVDGSVANPRPIVVGLQATESYPLVQITAEVDAIAPSTVNGEEGLRVTATLHNATDRPTYVLGACFNVRDKSGRLVGTTISSDRLIVAPQSSTVASAFVRPLAHGVSGEVVALAYAPTSPPP